MILRNNKPIVIIIMLLLLSTIIIHAQDWEGNESNYGWEFLGACTGELLLGVSPIIGSIAISSIPKWNNSNDEGLAILAVFAAYPIGGMVGAPVGTVLTGKIIHDEGSVFGAYAGGIIGTGLGVLTVYSYSKATAHVEQNSWPLVITAALILPPIMSVVGYQLGKPENQFQSYNSKNSPNLTFTVLPEKHNNKISPKIGANITFRF